MNSYIVKKPVITEKSLKLARETNTFVFEVARSANKDQIKAAVSELFGVDVVSVNTTTRPKNIQARGRKRIKMTSAKTKKALVKLKSGSTIELFDIGGAE